MDPRPLGLLRLFLPRRRCHRRLWGLCGKGFERAWLLWQQKYRVRNRGHHNLFLFFTPVLTESPEI